MTNVYLVQYCLNNKGNPSVLVKAFSSFDKAHDFCLERTKDNDPKDDHYYKEVKDYGTQIYWIEEMEVE